MSSPGSSLSSSSLSDAAEASGACARGAPAPQLRSSAAVTKFARMGVARRTDAFRPAARAGPWDGPIGSHEPRPSALSGRVRLLPEAPFTYDPERGFDAPTPSAFLERAPIRLVARGLRLQRAGP